MKFSQPTVFFSVFSSVIAYTSIAQVNSDIVNLDNAVQQLTAAVAAYNGGLFSEVPEAISFVVVEARLTQGDVDSGSLPPSLSESDTQNFINLVANTLAIDNPKAVKELEAKKALIEASNQQSIVEAGLKALLAGHLDFTENIVERSPPSKVQGVEDVANIITVALQDGINAFAQ